MHRSPATDTEAGLADVSRHRPMRVCRENNTGRANPPSTTDRITRHPTEVARDPRRRMFHDRRAHSVHLGLFCLGDSLLPHPPPPPPTIRNSRHLTIFAAVPPFSGRRTNFVGHFLHRSGPGPTTIPNRLFHIALPFRHTNLLFSCIYARLEDKRRFASYLSFFGGPFSSGLHHLA